MEEAESLGDRIGIMSKGKLVGLGTSQSLKKKYGEGYKINIASSNEEIINYINSQIPHAKVSLSVPGVIEMTVADRDLKSVPNLIRFLDKFDRKSMKSWNISQSTLGK
jgi:ATP-binding cassette, subfamily A (ABC1), member 3